MSFAFIRSSAVVACFCGLVASFASSGAANGRHWQDPVAGDVGELKRQMREYKQKLDIALETLAVVESERLKALEDWRRASVSSFEGWKVAVDDRLGGLDRRLNRVEEYIPVAKRDIKALEDYDATAKLDIKALEEAGKTALSFIQLLHASMAVRSGATPIRLDSADFQRMIRNLSTTDREWRR
jgi:hypothetical protein